MAKTASKNNPLSRQAKRKFMFNNKEVLFTKVYNIHRKSFKTAHFTNGELVTKNGKLVSWQSIMAVN